MPAEGSGLRLLLVAICAAMVGSFLNVVIYRLPRGLSVLRPVWSFCPACQHRIAPWWNVPILGWALLRGRCAACGSRIAVVYPVIEAANVLAWVMIWDGWEVSRMAPGAAGFPADWPLVISSCVLFSGFLAVSAMDIESYSIHIQVPLLCTAAGVIAHALRGWTGPSSFVQHHGALPPAVCWIVIAIGAVWLVMHSTIYLLGRRKEIAEESLTEPFHEAPKVADSSPSVAAPVNASWCVEGLAIAGLCLLTAALGWWMTYRPWAFEGVLVPPGGQRAIIATMIFFLMLVLASLTLREADEVIVQEIESERHLARANALREAAIFMPAVLTGVGVWLLLRSNSLMDLNWGNVPAAAEAKPLLRYCLGQPWLTGIEKALAATILGAAMGWVVRIFGTLAFGKEAFGTGDIYIMAAMGAVLGTWNVVIGFFLAAMLALVGVVATMFRKVSRAVPFGPWLALGSFGALWLERPLAAFFRPVTTALWTLLGGSPPRY